MDPLYLEDSGCAEHVESLDKENQKLQELLSLEDIINTRQAVSREIMSSLESMYPEAIDEDFPVNSYSRDFTNQNLEQSLESINWSKVFAVGMGALAIAAIISSLISFLREKVGNRAEQAKQNKEKVLKSYDHINNILKNSEVTEDQLDAYVKDTGLNTTGISKSSDSTLVPYESLAIARLTEGMVDSHPLLDDFIKDIMPGGKALSKVVDLGDELNDAVTNFNHRVNKLKDVIESLPESGPDDSKRIVIEAKRAQINDSKGFAIEVEKLYDYWERYGHRGEFRDLLKSEFVQTKDFYEIVRDSNRWIDGLDGLEGAFDRDVMDTLAETEKAAKELEDLQKKAKESINNSSVNVAIDDEAIRELKRAESSIRRETAAFHRLEHMLSYMYDSYNQLYAKSVAIHKEIRRIHNDIYNSNT